MGLSVKVGDITLPLQSLQLTQSLGSGLRIALELTAPAARQHTWQEVGEAWREGKARLDLGDIQQPDWRGTGWSLPPPGTLGNLGALHATAVEPDLRAWLSQAHQRGWLLYQRQTGEAPWDFLRRACGGHLSGELPEADETWERFIPAGACWARPEGLNNAEFLNFLIQNLQAVHPELEGWGMLGGQIFLISSRGDVQEPVELRDWDVKGDQIVEPSGLEGASGSMTLSWKIPAQPVAKFIASFLDDQEYKFELPEMPVPCLRTPWLVRIPELSTEVLVCHEVDYQMTVLEPDMLYGEMRLRIRRARSGSRNGSQAALRIRGEFKAWNGSAAVFTPTDSPEGPWKVVQAWQESLEAVDELDAAVLAPGSGASMLRFLLQNGEEQSLLLQPGQIPLALGTRQVQADLTEGAGAELSTETQINLQAKEVRAAGTFELASGEATLSTKLTVQDVEIGS
jgi:hypothetical protein